MYDANIKSYKNEEPRKTTTMKNLLTIISLLIFSLSVTANTTIPTTGGDDSEVVFENIDVQLSVLSSSDSDMIVSATYNQTNDFFNITTEQTINFLQVLNADGELEYQLPIGSNKLNIAMPDFVKGTYKVNLLMEGGDVFVSTELVKKF